MAPDAKIGDALRRQGLQHCDEFVGMRRRDSVIIVGGEDQERRIFHLLADVVKRRVGEQYLEVRFIAYSGNSVDGEGEFRRSAACSADCGSSAIGLRPKSPS